MTTNRTPNRTPTLSLSRIPMFFAIGYRPQNGIGIRSVNVAEVEVEIRGYSSRSTSPSVTGRARYLSMARPSHLSGRHVDVDNGTTR